MNPKEITGLKKIPLRFIPWAAIAHLARVMQSGASKYGWMNWREHAVKRSVYIEAALRHIMSLADGEDLDPGSGERHEAHAMACMAILLDARENEKLIDDRPLNGSFGRLVQKWDQRELESHVQKIADRAPPACPDLDQEFSDAGEYEAELRRVGAHPIYYER